MNQADQDRIDSRELAEDHVADLARMSEEFRHGWWRRIKRELPVQEIDPKAMTDEEAKEFGCRFIEFGQHAGKQYDAVPLDYLEWLVDTKVTLQRYLRNRRIAAERRADD